MTALTTSLVLLATTGGFAPAGATRFVAYPTRAWDGVLVRPLDPGPEAVRGAWRGQSRPASTANTGRRDELLSNETTFTRWAYVNWTAAIHARPNPASPIVSRLHWYTEDGSPEVYVVLRARWSGAREWIELRIPGRPNGRTGWVPRDALGAFTVTDLLVVVDRERLRMYVYARRRLLWTAPVGVGKPGTPTPAGHYWIRERFAIEDPRSGYWPYAFGTADYSTLSDWPGGGIVGIHGPYGESRLIPGAISHGCVRLRVADDAWLGTHLPLGAPVHVI